MGCKVVVLSRSKGKEAEALRLGADSVLITADLVAVKQAERTLDFILDTVSAKHSLGDFLKLLKTDGTMIVVGGVPNLLEAQLEESRELKRCLIFV